MTVVVEKEQVQLLAQSVLELLADIPVETATGGASPALEDPVEPLFRAGKLSIGYDPDEDRFLLEIDGVRTRDRGRGRSPLGARRASPRASGCGPRREQMLALSRHGAEVAERGRPTCRFCGNPMDPEGHVCPATNGHRAPRA